MKYCGYMPNDFVNGEGVSVSLWVSGCPHRCPGCFNEEAWDFNYGEEVPEDLDIKLIEALDANGVCRNFSILGGEPLAPENIPFVESIISKIINYDPYIKIYLWTGYTIEYLQEERKNNEKLNNILNAINVLIDGRYEQDKRDITLKLRGSSNQRILYEGVDF